MTSENILIGATVLEVNGDRVLYRRKEIKIKGMDLILIDYKEGKEVSLYVKFIEEWEDQEKREKYLNKMTSALDNVIKEEKE